MTIKLAVDVRARLAVIDPVAVADVEAGLGAVPPDRVLDESGKDGREVAIKRTGVDLRGRAGNDLGTAAWPVAGCAVRMFGAEPGQDPSADHKVVHQGVDGDHGGPDLDPGLPAARRRQQ